MHKVQFLQTILSGLPFPEIFISSGEVDPDTGDGKELIVDGQQRITTLYQYFTNSTDLTLGKGDIPRYSDLDSSMKLAFLEYEVVVRDLGPLTEEETREIFQRINSTKYSLNAMEVNNSRFDGELKKFAEEAAAHKFFVYNNFFTSLDGRRMNDTRFLLTVIITMLSGYFNRDAEHESYLERYNDEFPERASIWDRLTLALEIIDNAGFERNSRIWQKADLFTVLVELDNAVNLQGLRISPSHLRDTLDEFFAEVNLVTKVESPSMNAAEYFRRVRSGINNRMSRIVRGQIVAGLLESESRPPVN